MHDSVDPYLASLHANRRSPLTIKAARQDLSRFTTWWETHHQRSFDPALLLGRDFSD